MTLCERWWTCRILSKTSAGYSIEKVKILVKNGVVNAISPTNDTRDDFEGYVLISPFCNVHAHLGESAFRNISGNNWTLQRYLEYTNLLNENKTREEQQLIWEKSAQQTITELNHNGITMFCAGRSAAPAKRHNELTMAGYPIMNNSKLASYKEQGILGFNKYASEFKSDRISVGVFLHSLYANDSSSLELARTCMANGADFITVHVSEDNSTRQLEIHQYGSSPIQVLKKWGLLTERTLLVHCGYVDSDDLNIISDSGAMIAVCPISNAFLNTKTPDINQLDSKQIKWCVATDGWATGRTLSLTKQSQILRQQYPALSFQSLFEHITIIPAKLFCSNRYSGAIETGIDSRFIRIAYTGDSAEDLIKSVMTNYSEMQLITLKENA